MKRLALVIAGLLLAFAGVAAVLIVPNRMQMVWFVQSTGANEVVLPIGYWVAVGLWAWLVAHLIAVPVREIAARAVCVGFALHVLILLAAFAPMLGDPAAFSTSFYRMYARLFCAAVLAGATAWATQHFRSRGSAGVPSEAVALPVLFGGLVFGARFAQHDTIAAAAGLIAGVLLAGPRARQPRVGGLGAALRASGPAASRLGAWAGTVRRGLDDERLFLLFVVLVAFVLRLAYLRRIMTDPGYLDTGGDGATYDALAWSIAQGFGVPVAFRNGYPLLLLGYVWFVGAVYAVAGHSYFVIGAVQSALGALACLFLYGVAKPLFGGTVARVAAVFAAVSFPLIFAAVAIGHQAVDVFLTTLLLWLLLRALAVEGESAWRWAGIGLVLGCAIAVRETSAFFFAFLLVWVPFALRRSRRTDAARPVIAMVLGVGVVLTPLVLPMVSTDESRLRLRQHFDRLYTGQGDAIRTRQALVGPLEDPNAAIAQLRQRPVFVVGTMMRAILNNIGLQFFTQPFGGFDLIFLAKGSAYYYGMWFYAYALTCAGLATALRLLRAGGPQAAGAALVLGVIVFRTLPHLVLESHYRHRVPIEPFLILLASAAVVNLVLSSVTRSGPEPVVA